MVELVFGEDGPETDLGTEYLAQLFFGVVVVGADDRTIGKPNSSVRRDVLIIGLQLEFC